MRRWRGLGSVLWAVKSPAELLAANLELERLRSQVASVQAQVAVEIEHAEAAKSEGWASTRDYLTATAGARRGAGGRLLKTARGLTAERQATWLALQGGDLPRARRGHREGGRQAAGGPGSA